MKRRSVLIGGLGLCAASVPLVASASTESPPRQRLHISWPGEFYAFECIPTAIDATQITGPGPRPHVDHGCFMAAIEWAGDALSTNRRAEFRTMAEPVAVLLPGRQYTFRLGDLTFGPPDPRGVRVLVFDASGRPLRHVGRLGYTFFGFYPSAPERGLQLSSGLCVDTADWLPRIEVDGRVVMRGTWPGEREE